MIPEILAIALDDKRKETVGKYICSRANTNGEAQMTASSFRRAWSSYMHYLNIQAGGSVATRSRKKVQKAEIFTPHQLRHTYATLLHNATVSSKSAQTLLGHASIQMTLDVYTHLDDEQRAKDLGVLNQYIHEHFD